MNRRILLGSGIIAAVGLSLPPFLWFIADLGEVSNRRRGDAAPWWPSGNLGFYRTALFDHHLFDYVLNSVVVAGSTTLLALLLAIPAAYALARLTIPGKRGACWRSCSASPCSRKNGHRRPDLEIARQPGGLNHRWGASSCPMSR